MERKEINGTGLWQFEKLARHSAIKHFVSDRKSVLSEKEFTLSYSSSPDREHIQSNRRHIAHALGITEDTLFLPSQVHETHIVNVTPATKREELMNTDALISNSKAVAIAVMSADCVPILLFDKKNLAVGAVHAGWKGTVARILEKTLLRMKQEFGTEGKDLVAAIGPSVCQRSYEVGGEVIEAVRANFTMHHELLQPKGEKAHLDLWEANRVQLEEFGVPAENIELAGLCTVENNDFFFSARKGDRGRFAAGIMLA